MVLQDTWLFDGTIAENISYGRPGASEDEVVEAAKAAHVDRFVRTLPEGYQTQVSNNGGNVSAGEKQLITIARAFLARPQLLILDEATSSVDTCTELLIQRAMSALRRNRTSFIIAHRLSTIRDADHILVVEAGKVVEQGNHAELLARRGAYYRMTRTQDAADVMPLPTISSRSRGHARPGCPARPRRRQWQGRSRGRPTNRRTKAAVTARPTQHPGGLGRAQVVLGAFVLGGPRVQSRTQFVVGPAENRHQQQGDAPSTRCRSPTFRRGARPSGRGWIRQRCTARSAKTTAPHRVGRGARRSATDVRAPLKRHTTIALASASAPPPSAHPVSATDPTASPCHSPTAPSMSTTARLTQASRRAHRASRRHPASGATGVGCANSAIEVVDLHSAMVGPRAASSAAMTPGRNTSVPKPVTWAFTVGVSWDPGSCRSRQCATATMLRDAGISVDWVDVSAEPNHVEQFRTDVARVYEVTINAGTATLYHRHDRDTVYVITAGGRFRSQEPGHQRSRTSLGRSTGLGSQLRLLATRLTQDGCRCPPAR